jgi:type I restriction enzyme M protein
MSLSANISEKAALIWAIADKLTGVYKPHEYGEVILPLTVIRRFDCILSDTKDAVLEKYENIKALPMRDVLLRKASGQPFYNSSKFTFERLLSDPDNIEANFRDYLNGFSENVQNIIEKFKFDGHINTMSNKGILYIVLKEFTSPRANLHPSAISNLEMGYIFEEIIRRFSESHNEDAGQHYTPREVIKLMVNVLFNDDNDILSGNNVAKTIYDPACGTGGMLSVAEEYLHELNAATELMAFGQEINDQTFAICKADMLIKGNNAEFIKNGNTLSNDKFEGQKFDYIISNPPFGREWKNEKSKVEAEAKRGFAGRFGPGLPAVGDGQMLFLLTAISKMKDSRDGGSRIAVIQNGSPLTTGDAESGPSNIRKYILDNDLLEAVIALPQDLFYNTNLATFIWIISNRKSKSRIDKVLLIDASKMFVRRRKALGKKKNDISDSQIAEITRVYAEALENPICRIVDKEFFSYQKVTVEFPQYDKNGNIVIKNGKKIPDLSRRTSIKVPLSEDVKNYFNLDVLKYQPNAWYEENKIKIGFEIPFTKIFFTPLDTHLSEVIQAQKIELLDSVSDSLNKIAYNAKELTRGLNMNCEVYGNDCLVDWLEKIPKHWTVIKAKHIFRIRDERGNEMPQLLAATQKFGMRPQDEIEGVVQVKEDTDLQTFKTVHKNDYVISLRSFQGGFEMSDFEGVCSPAYQVFYPVVTICPMYFKKLFKSTRFIEKINSLNIGIRDGKNIAFQDFGEVYIGIPPLDEQEAIVESVNKKVKEAFSRIQILTDSYINEIKSISEG